jgi:5-methylcytosine-specific restriction endonuclease McrA
MKHSYTHDDALLAIQTSENYSQALTKLKLSPKGDNYKTIKKYCIQNNVDTSHFSRTSKYHSNPKKAVDLSVYLSNAQSISSFRLKNRLLCDKILVPVCANCRLSEWMGGSIPLELDHIDGQSNNNVLSNLRLLCPNCHALTPTYRGKNKRVV